MDRIAEERPHRIVIRDDGVGVQGRPLDEASIGDLFRRLSSDALLLLRQEISLAKAELRESGDRVKEAARTVVIAGLLAIPGGIALTAFLVIALGEAIGSYWASALIVGAVLLGTAAILARRGLDHLKDSTHGMKRTAASLGDEARWGKEELRAFKRELTA